MLSLSNDLLDLVADYAGAWLPIALFLMAVVVFGLSLQANGMLRLLSAFTFTVLDIASWWTIDRSPASLGNVLGLVALVWLAHAHSVLWLEPATLPYEHASQEPPPEPLLVEKKNSAEIIIVDSGKAPSHPTLHRYLQGWRIWNNFRLIGTTREVSDVPLSRPTCCLTSFVAYRVAKLAIYYFLVIHIQLEIFPGAFRSLSYSAFDSTHQTYLRRLLFATETPVTLEETSLRVVFAVLWGWTLFVALDSAYTVLSIFFVSIIRLDEPEDWPPFFGDLRDAYTIRAFWCKFWTRAPMRGFGNFGELFSRTVLHAKEGGKVEKSVVCLTVFLFSGLAQAAVSWRLGDRCGWKGDVWWYMLQFLVVAIETVVVVWWKRRKAAERARRPSQQILRRGSVPGAPGITWAMAVGYLWVFAFFFWSVPKWQYPKMYCFLQ